MKQKNIKGLPLFILIVSVLCLLAAGYFIYQKSIRTVIYSTTVSFMEQIAEHDQQNMINQMDSKLNALTTITNRVDAARKYTMEEVFNDLSLNVASGTFKQLYLVTDQDKVYSHTALKTDLDDMTWKDDYLNSTKDFVTIYRESSREHWGEYMVCGTHLEAPVQCGKNTIVGIIGLVPISSIADQMRLESFDQMGVTAVMQSSGEIITSSTVYDSNTTNNYLKFLESSKLRDDLTLKDIQSSIKNNKQQLIRFSSDGNDFYTLIEPLDDDYHSDWYLVVQLSDKITTDQVQRLLLQSLIFFVLIGVVCLAAALFVYRKLSEIKTLRIVEQTKTKFLANMSHEIRTPLNGISGLCYLMQENLDNREKLTEYLQKTIASTSFLKDIINDVLDMSKIESGQLELVYRDMNLPKLLEEVKTLLETQAQDKQIDFSMEIQNLIQNQVVGDDIRIKQILMNLLGNALKFTPEKGAVSLTVSQTLEAATASTTFIIKDNGCGMSPEFLTRIWQPFEQENREINKNGTGLGTTISKTLVEKMDGSISVESSPNEGTIFTITIPFPISNTPETEDKTDHPKKTVDLRGMRILVAEDNEVNRLIITTVLENEGCILTEAVNGREAVDIFESKPQHSFDLILMDIQMPVMDGYEASRHIRQSSHPDAKAITIFAVTANAFQEDLDKALAAGMNDAITKPLDMSMLLDKIGRTEKGDHV